MHRFVINTVIVAAVSLCVSIGYAAEADNTVDNEILNFEETAETSQASDESSNKPAVGIETASKLTVYDANGNVIGSAESSGKVLDLGGNVIGQVDENNNVRDVNGNIIGSVKEEPATADISLEKDENTVEESEETVDEEVLVLDVFPPEFMASLRICRKDSEANGQRVFEIKGMRGDKCHLTYGNYILNVPTNVLNNIHSFDDLQLLLRNKDMARYRYLPEYTYEGLIYALNACAHKEKYYCVEIEEERVDAVVTRGLSAEYTDETCEIYLQNELELDENLLDYGVTCRLNQEAIDELEPYFTDIIAKYNNVETTELHKHKEIRDADIALMYYLQQNNYCNKNNKLKD